MARSRSRSPHFRPDRFVKDPYADTLLEVLAAELSDDVDLVSPSDLRQEDAVLTLMEFRDQVRLCTSFTEGDIRDIFDHFAVLQLSALQAALQQARARLARKKPPVCAMDIASPHVASYLAETIAMPSPLLLSSLPPKAKLLPDTVETEATLGLNQVAGGEVAATGIVVASSGSVAIWPIDGLYVDHWRPDTVIVLSDATERSVTITCPEVGWEPSQASRGDDACEIHWGELHGYVRRYASGALVIEWNNTSKWLRQV